MANSVGKKGLLGEEDIARGYGTFQRLTSDGITYQNITKLSYGYEVINVKDYGAVGDGITDDTAAIIVAVAAAPAKTLFFPSGDYVISSDLTIPATVKLEFDNSAFINTAANVTVTINTSVSAWLGQIFKGDGTITFGTNAILPIFPEWWGAKGDGITDDVTAIEAAITASKHYGKIIFQTEREYIVKSQIDIAKPLSLMGSGFPFNDNRGATIKYNGAVSATTAVIKWDSTTVAMNGCTMEGVKIDANSKAGYCLHLSSPTATNAFTYFYGDKLNLINFTASGIFFTAQYQLSDGAIYNSYIYSANNDVYGVNHTTGSNFSNFLFQKTSILGSAGGGNMINCAIVNGNADFDDCIFKATKAQSGVGTDGYAVYLGANGWSRIANCRNEGNGLLYFTGGYGTNTSLFTIVENSGCSAGTYAIIAHPYKVVGQETKSIALIVRDCGFSSDCLLSTGSASDLLEIKNNNFTTGKGWIEEGRSTIGDNTTTLRVSSGFGYNQKPIASYTWDGTEADAYFLTQLAQKHIITLAANITTLEAPTGVASGAEFEIEFIQGGAGTYTVSWSTDFIFSGGSAPVITVGVGKKSIIRFIFDGAKCVEVLRNLNIS